MKDLEKMTVEELREVANKKIEKVENISDKFNLEKAKGSLSNYINSNTSFSEKFREELHDQFFDSIREEKIEKEQKELENNLEEDLKNSDSEEEKEELKDDFDVECEEIRESMYEKTNTELFEELDQEQLIRYIDLLEDYSYDLVCDVREYREEK